MKILIVEDEIDLQETISSFLQEEGHVCEACNTLDSGLEKLEIYEYDCLLVDIGLPDGSGFNLVSELKRLHPETGIIIISARNSIDDKIEGFDLGADDYLSKPFHLTELSLRIKSLMRRLRFSGKKEIEVGKLRILPDSHEVFALDQPVILTKKEFDLLIFFTSNLHRVLTKESIAEHLWGDFADTSDSFDFVYSQIKNLRHKLLEKTGVDYFKNVYGSGYAFNTNDEK
ncbi:MAG TPA: response regulator transcription factor [Prolixibacteraceae bacterium]|nr:response regulator transcription factor [Prolixibacteraceae bacterium]